MSDSPYQRHHTAVCGDAALGIFMQHLSRFFAGAKCPARFTDGAGVEREGIARTWEQWAEELGLSLKQFRRVLEKAVRLGYIVRARRTWGKYRVIRLHVAITTAYVNELTRCVALGTKAYLKATGAPHPLTVGETEGQYAGAPLGNTNLPTEGNTVLPTEGNYIEDSSLTLSKTLTKTAFVANADEAQSSPIGPSSREKTLTQSPHSPPFPDGGEHAGHTATATQQGMATKLSALGLLAEWQRECAAHGATIAESVTDEQLDALARWCSKKGSSRSEQLQRLVWTWDELAADMCMTDEALEQQWQAPNKPCLKFLLQVVDACRDTKNLQAPSPDKSRDAVQSIASTQAIL